MGLLYLGNENEIRSRPHFPIEQMCISHGARGHITMLSHHQLKIQKEFKWEENAFKKVSFINAYMYIHIKIKFWTAVVSNDLKKFWGEWPIKVTRREKQNLLCKVIHTYIPSYWKMLQFFENLLGKSLISLLLRKSSVIYQRYIHIHITHWEMHTPNW